MFYYRYTINVNYVKSIKPYSSGPKLYRLYSQRVQGPQTKYFTHYLNCNMDTLYVQCGVCFRQVPFMFYQFCRRLS